MLLVLHWHLRFCAKCSGRLLGVTYLETVKLIGKVLTCVVCATLYLELQHTKNAVDFLCCRCSALMG